MATGLDAKPEQPTVFLRKASGVVKAFSPFDAFIYNCVATSIMATGAYVLVTSAGIYPGGNLVVGILITMVLCIFLSIVYALLVSSMPRSGGDYVFQSRLLSGSVGFIAVLPQYVTGQALWFAVVGSFLSGAMLAPFLLTFGGLYDIQAFKDASAWLVTPGGVAAGGIVICAWCVFINAVGFKAYATVQRWAFWIGIVTASIMVGMMALSSREQFINSFNSFMQKSFGAENVYQGTIDAARAAGFSGTFSFDWSQTIMIIPVAFFTVIWTYYAVSVAGEIRNANAVSLAMKQMMGAQILVSGLLMLVAYLSATRFGNEFLSSATWMWLKGVDSPLPVPPFYAFFAAAITTNPVLIFIVLAAMLSWQLMAIPNAIAGGSRMILAAAMDRVVPEWIGRVNQRTHTPLNAIICMGILGVVYSILYAYTGFATLTYSVGLIGAVCLCVTCFGAAAWPFTKPELFKSSPAGKYHIAGVPIITIFGGIFSLASAWVLYIYMTKSELGMNSTIGLIFNIGLYVVAGVIYFGFKYYRKMKDSLDLSMVYREIPPE